MLRAAAKAEPKDAQFAQLIARLEKEQAAARQAASRQATLESLRALIAGRQWGAETGRSVGEQINNLLKTDPQDRDAAGLREQFLRGLLGSVQAANSFDSLAPVQQTLKEIQRLWGERSVDVSAVIGALRSKEAELALAEQQRLAALQGTLVLNAAPWATVESVVEQATGKRVSLPSDASTPLLLTLPQGRYNVTFKHPSVSRSVVQVASVRAKETQTASVTFPTVGADGYLKRAGYAN
jgi:hypothetical protein